MITFILSGTRVELDFSFFAAIGIYTLYDRTGYALLFILACLCHEGGHLIAMGISETKPERITFCGAGIRITGGFKSIFIFLSGCAVNFILALIFFFCTDDMFLSIFAVANILTGILNLIPIGGFDGKRILEMAVNRILPPEPAQKVVSKAGIVFTVAAIFGITLLFSLKMLNMTFIIVSIYLILLEIAEK